MLVEFTNCFLPAMVYMIDVTRNIIRPKTKKYKVIRLARVGFQKEQKHLKCSMIFMLVTFDEIVSHHIASYWEIVKSYYVTGCNKLVFI